MFTIVLCLELSPRRSQCGLSCNGLMGFW